MGGSSARVIWKFCLDFTWRGFGSFILILLCRVTYLENSSRNHDFLFKGDSGSDLQLHVANWCQRREEKLILRYFRASRFSFEKMKRNLMQNRTHKLGELQFDQTFDGDFKSTVNHIPCSPLLCSNSLSPSQISLRKQFPLKVGAGSPFLLASASSCNVLDGSLTLTLFRFFYCVKNNLKWFPHLQDLSFWLWLCHQSAHLEPRLRLEQRLLRSKDKNEL